MSNRKELLTPVGRLVQGSLYEPQTTDAENKPLTVRTGPNQGQPRVEYYFALAIEKGTERHWAETPWGALVWAVGHAGFPNGQADASTFAWKIVDGDSTIPNRVGKKPCDREGYPRHWILNFNSGFAPGIYTDDGSQQILEPNFINLGDYIQVYGSINDNGSLQQPGVFLNHSMIAFSRYGTRIILGADPKSVGFGKSPIPSGALTMPPEGRFNPAPVSSLVNSPISPVIPPVPSSPPVPHYGILTPSVPSVPVRVMLSPAGNHTYEQLIANGWTDALLVQHGMMAP